MRSRTERAGVAPLEAMKGIVSSKGTSPCSLSATLPLSDYGRVA